MHAAGSQRGPNRVQLVRPAATYEQSYRSYLVELGETVRYPFQLDFDPTDFSRLLARLRDFEAGRHLPTGFVPTSTYWLIDSGELVGVSSLRHHLNKRLHHCGGHLGLGIRPSRQGSGLGNHLMDATIQQAAQRGLGRLHVHCHAHNQASARLIVRNGGVLHSEIDDGDPPTRVQRYIIQLADG